MSIAPNQRPTYSDYLASQEHGKTVWFHGEVFAMSGGTLTHNRITTRLLRALVPADGCEAVNSDQRLRIEASDLSCYPDVMLICGRWQTSDDDPHAITNPLVLFEVLSPSTEAWDRGSKFQAAQHLPSLRQYVLLSQTERLIEVFTRNDDASWTLTRWTSGPLPLADLEHPLLVEACYDGLL